MRTRCNKAGCRGECPASVIVAGYNKGTRTTCRECGSFYPKPNPEVLDWYANKPKYQQEHNNQTDKSDKNKLENEVKILRKKLQQYEANKEEGDNPKEGETIKESGDLDKELAKKNAFLTIVKQNRPDDKTLIQTLEEEAEAIRTKKLQAKPLHTRQLQASRKLEKARAQRDNLRAALEAEEKRHTEAMHKLTEDIAEAEGSIKKLEQETKELLRVASGTACPSASGNFVETVMGIVEEQVPPNLSLLPDGAKFVENLKESLAQFATALDTAKQQMLHQQRAQAEKTENEATIAAEQAKRALGDKECDVEMELGDAQIEEIIDDLVGEYNAEAETEEQWKARKQAYKHNFQIKAVSRIRNSIKTKVIKK